MPRQHLSVRDLAWLRSPMTAAACLAGQLVHPDWPYRDTLRITCARRRSRKSWAADHEGISGWFKKEQNAEYTAFYE